MGYRIFNMPTEVNTCHFTWGYTDTTRVAALKIDSGRRIPRHAGELNLHQQLAGLTLYQLSYIPTPITHQKYFSAQI